MPPWQPVYDPNGYLGYASTVFINPEELPVLRASGRVTRNRIFSDNGQLWMILMVN